MSRHVVIGLFAEGPSDFRFLTTLLFREAFALVSARGTQAVIVSEPVVRLPGRSPVDRANVACESARDVDIFVVHADASRTGADAVRRETVDALRTRAREGCAVPRGRFVGLIPIREMEAWALCDEEAIAVACGFENWPRSRLVPWSRSEIERIEDPKRALDEVVADLLGRRSRRRTAAAAAYLDRIGELASLERLRELASYRAFADDLAAAFAALGLLRQG